MKFKLKKICAIFMIGILLLGVVGCAKASKTSTRNSATDDTVSLSGKVTNFYQRDDADIKNAKFVNDESRAGKGGAEKEASELKQKILNAKDNVKIDGTAYYFSPGGDDENDGKSPENAFRTLGMITSLDLKAGDGIFLERGSVFRIKGTIACDTDGITFAAYGEGTKPQIWASEDLAGKNLWKPTNRKNIWVTDYLSTDVGLIVFDYGEKYGVKRFFLRALVNELDFTYDREGKLYLYSSSDPNTAFKSIEVCGDVAMLYGSPNVKDIVIDNICFKLTSGHAVSFGENAKNITITNCELGWIGGAIQTNDGTSTQQYGNAIQFWESAENVKVENCYVYQTFDAALTIQGQKLGCFKDIYFKGNLLEYNAFNIEFWSFGKDKKRSGIVNFYIQDNIMRFAGYVQGHESRPDVGRDGHIVAAAASEAKETPIFKNYVVSGNIFDCAYTQIATDFWTKDAWNRVKSEYKFSNNTYYMKSRKSATWPYILQRNNLVFGIGCEAEYGRIKFTTANNQSELEKAIAAVESNPKLVKWLDD